jgi:hypothetical protein
MSQESLILTHLKTKPITGLDALFDYNCFRLAARICDLRNKGHLIEKRWIVKGDKRYAQYWLDDPFGN